LQSLLPVHFQVGCRYETAKKKGDYDEETQKRENAKQALERYMHYYQRWAENDKARLQVLPSYTSQKHQSVVTDTDRPPGRLRRFLL